MIHFLRGLFLVVLASMLWVTTRASLQQSLFAIPREVITNPWFIATLFDAYWAFITFYVWMAWKEQSLAARLLWFIAVIALGNIAMAVYMLVELFRVPAAGPAGEALHTIFTRRNPGRLVLPAVFVVGSAVIYLLA
jgi:hypothetical protein